MEGIAIFSYGLLGFLVSILVVFFGFKVINKLTYGPRSSKNARQDKNLKQDTIRICHLNVKWVPGILRKWKNTYNKERANLIADEFSQYDVVCLNEAYSYVGSPVKSFIQKMSYFGFKYVARSPSASLTSLELVDGGVIILSKLPILRQNVLTFSLSNGIDMAIGKSAVYARIQTNQGAHVHLVATCLQSPVADSYDMCKAVRMCQLREIRAMLQRSAMDGCPIVIIGDLNVDAHLPEAVSKAKVSEYQRMIENMTIDEYTLTDGLYESYNEHPTTLGDAAHNTLTEPIDQGANRSVDYVWLFSRNEGNYVIDTQNSTILKFEAKNQKFSHLSDHYGVLAEISLSLEAKV